MLTHVTHHFILFIEFSMDTSILLLTLLSLTSSALARDLVVGGKSSSWKVPTSEADSLNKWAEATRFRIGDTLVWDYDGEKDSVLEVTREAYLSCNVTDSVAEYKDGSTRVELTRSGAHFFISGIVENCVKGQKLIVVVMAPRSVLSSSVASPEAAPAIAPTSGGFKLRYGPLMALYAMMGFALFF